MTTTWTLRWQARGLTDDVTTCDHCGRVDLKATVRMVAVDPDGNDDGEQYMGVVCAAKMTGRKAAEIRTEAARAGRERAEEIRRVHRAWFDAHHEWFMARRDAALGPNARPRDILAWSDTPEHRAAEAEWRAEHPEPARV